MTYRGTIQTETYQISEKDGNLFIETGLSILLTYDKDGGVYDETTQIDNP